MGVGVEAALEAVEVVVVAAGAVRVAWAWHASLQVGKALVHAPFGMPCVPRWQRKRRV